MPSPSCRDTRKYEWLGRLMSAAIQSDENIVVSFPPYVWKKIAHYPVTVADYKVSIDACLSSYEAMLTMDEETFEFSFEEVQHACVGVLILAVLRPHSSDVVPTSPASRRLPSSCGGGVRVCICARRRCHQVFEAVLSDGTIRELTPGGP